MTTSKPVKSSKFKKYSFGNAFGRLIKEKKVTLH